MSGIKDYSRFKKAPKPVSKVRNGEKCRLPKEIRVIPEGGKKPIKVKGGTMISQNENHIVLQVKKSQRVIISKSSLAVA